MGEVEGERSDGRPPAARTKPPFFFFFLNSRPEPKPAITHGFVEKELISGEMVGAQQTAEDADSRLEQIHVGVLAEG